MTGQLRVLRRRQCPCAFKTQHEANIAFRRSYSQAFAPSLGALRDSLMNNLRITYKDGYAQPGLKVNILDRNCRRAQVLSGTMRFKRHGRFEPGFPGSSCHLSLVLGQTAYPQPRKLLIFFLPLFFCEQRL